MTSRRLLLAFVAHRALLAGEASWLDPKRVRGRMALNARLVLHVEAAVDRIERQGKVAA